ncbi:hypothetical protein SuNHUV7_32850 (plasmid) [Pseudoseohaeicola sp. NH-UV-7]|uniref:DUF2059 domain-containing protein n=1 Tax=Sulfitobacter sp. TBRI5 TaxID=2989732 RepID=UPI003A5DEEED
MPRPLLILSKALVLGLVLSLGSFWPAQAADRARLEAFLTVTGFDVALESIKLSAASAPEMLGLDTDAFGDVWTRLADDIFETETLHDMALDILEQTLSDDLLAHAAEFYASDLGQRLVVAENASHMMEDDTAKSAQGEAIVAQLVADGSDRLNSLNRMNAAIDTAGHGVRALQEIQLRFLMAAAAAGVIELRIDIEDLRGMMREQEGELRRAMQKSGLSGAAYTYRDFSDAEVLAYAKALEHPDMKLVYELMNAVQYEIMANRFEKLAARMADLHPGTEL